MAMNVTVAESDKLKRKLSVEVPLKEVQAAYESVYVQLKSNVRINGFRPGRFPRNLAEKRFKSAMASEAMQSLVPKYYQEALSELDVRPATEPRFENLEIDQKRPFKFDVEFEIFPTFELLPPSSFELKEKKPKVSAKDVESRIEEILDTRASYEDKSGPAVKGDAVTFDFRGTLDGEPFDGGTGEDQRIEVGSAQYLPDFDAAFHGMSVGESKTSPMTFPADYEETSLAGKEVYFEITAKKVEHKVRPALTRNFFPSLASTKPKRSFGRASRNSWSRKSKRRWNSNTGTCWRTRCGKNTISMFPKPWWSRGCTSSSIASPTTIPRF